MRRYHTKCLITPSTLITLSDIGCRYKIGDSFFSLPVSEVQEQLSASVDKISVEVESLEEKLGGIKDEMSELKAELYGRFGRSINLEA